MIYTSTDSNFVRDTASGWSLVDFWAPWCGPCQAMGPILEAFDQSGKHPIKIMKHNVDIEPEMANAFHIRGIPTIILFHDGREVTRVSGVQTTEALEELLKNHLQ